MIFTPTKKLGLGKDFVKVALTWGMIMLFVVFGFSIFGGAISEKYPGLSSLLTFAIIIIGMAVVCFYALKGNFQAASKRMAFLYEDNELYVFFRLLDTMKLPSTLGYVFGTTGQVAGAALIGNQQKNLEKLVSTDQNVRELKNNNCMDKIVKINNLVKQKDGYKINCVLEDYKKETSTVNIYIRDVYYNYDKLVQILKKIKKGDKK